MSIKFNNVSYTYNNKSIFSSDALKHINVEFLNNKNFVAIVGKTGSGKSTLIQLINGLLKPTEGEIDSIGYLITPKKRTTTKKIKELRNKIGIVFQFPEYQLFEETVLKDVMFGPKNYGFSQEECLKTATESLNKVGLDKSFYERSPFELSGGEKRRVAIAGILAIKPEILILDEPTAGLDPIGSFNMMEMFKKIADEGTKIIIVTHDMNIVWKYCDDVAVLDNGEIVFHSSKEELFKQNLEKFNLDKPEIYKYVEELNNLGLKLDINNIKDVDDLIKEIKDGHYR